MAVASRERGNEAREQFIARGAIVRRLGEGDEIVRALREAKPEIVGLDFPVGGARGAFGTRGNLREQVVVGIERRDGD